MRGRPRLGVRHEIQAHPSQLFHRRADGPMGRREYRPEYGTSPKLYLQRLPISNGYDRGGAYWGLSGQPVGRI